MLWSLPFAVRAGHHPPVRAAIASWFPIQLLPRLDRFGSSNPTASPGTSGRFTVRRMFQKRPEDLQEIRTRATVARRDPSDYLRVLEGVDFAYAVIAKPLHTFA